MQNTVSPAVLPERAFPSRLRALRPVLPIALAAAADWLFFDGPTGVSLSVFIGLVAVAVLAGNRLRANRREAAVATATFGLCLLPSIETTGFLALCFGFGGLAAFALGVTGRLRVALPTALRRAVVLLTGNAAARLRRAVSQRPRRHSVSGLRAALSVLGAWVIPAAIGLVFVRMFASANPVFESWIGLLDLRWILSDLQPARYAFWLLVAFAAVPFVRVPAFRQRPRAKAASARTGSSGIGSSLVLRSLIVVNLVFALQTGLDAVYLWGGSALPPGVSPAEDAQGAAHVLVLSALLAAGLVLLAGPAALRPERSGSRTAIRILLHAWIAQNVVLVLSAMLRLELYVETYALTEARVTAFVWMGLVACGLMLIEWRLVFAKSGIWLVGVNLLALCVALYACILLDLSAIVARYNVEHSEEFTGTGVPLDRAYLCSLGGSALPAMDAFLERRRSAAAPGTEDWSTPLPPAEHHLTDCASNLRREFADGSEDWRGWTFREHRLRRYIERTNDSSRRPDHAAENPGRR
jgi:hypothetical protein